MGSEAQAIEAEAGPDYRRHEPKVVAAVALGGALGAPVRYGISQAVHITPGTFPWGTFWINVSGSLAQSAVIPSLDVTARSAIT